MELMDKYKGVCPYGLTHDELEIILGSRMPEFMHWMRGQTVMLCDGREYDHDEKAYKDTACAPWGHGVVTYRWDLDRFLRGLPIID